MQNRTRKLLWMLTIMSVIILGECLTITALPTNDGTEELTTDLFHIGTVYIHINVTEDLFDPAEFTVYESATVNITFESLDIGHTFEIVEYGISEEVLANDTINFEFEADTLGEFTYFSENCTETGTMIVESPYVEDLPRPEDVIVIFDYKHNSDSSAIEDKYSGLFNWSMDSGFTTFVNYGQELVYGSEGNPGALDGLDILVILEPDVDFNEPELDDLGIFLRSGGCLIIGGSEATAEETNTWELTKPFGFTFSNATAKYINATAPVSIGENNTLNSFTFTDLQSHPIVSENQYVPLSDETLTAIEYTGTVLNFNVNWTDDYYTNDNLTDSRDLIDSYIFAQGNDTIFSDINNDGVVDANETIGSGTYETNNTLVAIAETATNGRVIGIGSADILNDTMIGRYLYNDNFIKRAFQWGGDMYAVLQNTDYSLSSLLVKRNEIINVTAGFQAQNSTTLSGLNVSVRIWQAELIVDTIYLTTTDDINFEGQIDTTPLRKGIYSADVVVHKRGYGYNVTSEFFIEVQPADPGNPNVPFIYILTFSIAVLIGIGVSVLFFTRVFKGEQPQTQAEPTTVSSEEESEEDEDEVDLDEYESDES